MAKGSGEDSRSKFSSEVRGAQEVYWWMYTTSHMETVPLSICYLSTSAALPQPLSLEGTDKSGIK